MKQWYGPTKNACKYKVLCAAQGLKKQFESI